MSIPKEEKPRLELGTRFNKGVKAPDNLEWHKIKNGDSLESIAKDYGWRLEDLFLYNWKTVNKLQVNWYLRKYVGCSNHNGTSYIFTGAETPGMILVPKSTGIAVKGPGRVVVVPRDGKATLDSHLQVMVLETLADADIEEVSGKWLYVFSGAGIDFGYEPPPQIRRNREGATVDDQPGSAFTLDFPGVYHLKEKPDKVEYEIYVTSTVAPSPDSIKAVSGLKETGKTKLEFGNKWYFLSDSTVLEKAKTESRRNRETYIPRNFKTVSIDLAPDGQNRRFYFLLSPVKLGPEAIKYAMNHPNGLTPLLKDNVRTIITDPSHPPLAFDPNDPKQNLGPVPEDIKKNPVLLMVIDPYAWAENIANQILPKRLTEYEEWVGSKHNETTKKLTAETTWTLDHLYVAKLLKSVSDSHPKKGSIDIELEDSGKWLQYLNLWEKEIDDRNATILANLHRSIMQLIKWLEGDAHKIIETAILRDTNPDNPKDAADIAIGLIHWGICSEQMITLEPGIAYLNHVFNQSGYVVHDLLLKYFKDLDTNTAAFNIKATLKFGWRLSNHDVLLLNSLRDFVSFQPPIGFKGTRKEFLAKLGEYLEKKTGKLIKLLNDHQILPGEVQAVPLTSLKSSSVWDWQSGSTALTTSLDFIDKNVNLQLATTLDITKTRLDFYKNWKEQDYAGAWQDATLYERYALKYKRVFWKIKTPGWAFKGTAIVVSAINLINVFTASRYDYQTNQMTVSTTEYLNAGSSLTLAVQDTLVEIGDIIKYVKGKETWMNRAFPSLVETNTVGRVGFSATHIRGLWGGMFATINVAASLICGITTIISMNESRQKSVNRGDYTAAKFYTAGIVGGALIVGGGAAMGMALLTAGGYASLSGIGATIGVILILVGGIIVLISSIFGSKNTSDDYQVFARKCFLGKERKLNPRFGDDPEDWSHAPKIGEWTIQQQKRAILNLLGRFTLQTSSPNPNLSSSKGVFKGGITYDITPGLIMPGTTIEIELYNGFINQNNGNSNQTTSSIVEWGGPQASQMQINYRLLKFTKGNLFAAEKTIARFNFVKDAVTSIYIWAEDVNFVHKRLTGLLTDVTIRYPGLENVIRTRKLVMRFPTYSNSPNAIKALEIDHNKEISGLFE